MNSEVKKWIDTKFNVFDEYYDVPEDVAEELVAFRARLDDMADDCKDVIDFEERFVSAGFQAEYNAFFARCTARPVKLTAEQKKESRRLFNEMAFGSNDKKVVAGKVAAMVAEDAVSHTMVELESEAIKERRERMIEDGTFVDYTHTSNKINNIERAAGIFKKLLKK